MPGFTIEELRRKLREIDALESKIQERVCDKSLIAEDVVGVELNKLNINLKIKLMAQELMNQRAEEEEKALKQEDTQSPLKPLLVILMDGGVPFGNKLRKELHKIGYKHDWTTLVVSSWGDDTASSGHVQIQSGLKILVGGRKVYIVDDVCDTGQTYIKVKDRIEELGAESVELLVLVDKKQQRLSPDAHPLHAAFEVDENAFIIGWGLDYRRGGETRNLTDIRVVDLNSLATEEEMQILNKKEEFNEMLVAALLVEKQQKAAQKVLCSSRATFSYSGNPESELNLDAAISSLSN
ncbi:MAG: phosphoribosyltransferase family protein [Legionella sp.]|nr:phosphoribosyltransferase family protein [Legionella sp.]